MLGPDDGATLLDALAPPDGCTLDAGVGTSFTLDLTALLSIPTAFALTRTDDAAGTDETPLSLLEALRSYAGRVTVFCDAAHIGLPETSDSAVFGFLEDAVVPVRAPGGGLFHPKLWALRFIRPDGSYLHRLLIASRNLTFDRSWDTVVRLDEEPDDPRACALPELAGVTRALLDLPTPSGSSDARSAQVRAVAETIGAARFAPPPGFHDVRLHPLGLDVDGAVGSRDAHASGRRVPDLTSRIPFPDEARRSLVVSPFLGGGLLSALGRRTRAMTVVARTDELDRAYAAIDEAERPEAFDLDPRLVDDSGDEALTELHAKIFVHDVPGATARVFVGSANATDAAFTRNSEVLLEMSGPSRDVGVKAFLSDGRDALRSLLVPHTWSAPPEDESDDAATVRALQQELARLDLTATVHARGDDAVGGHGAADDTAAGGTPTDDGPHGAGADDLYTVTYRSEAPLPDLRGATVELRPITLPEWSLQDGDVVHLPVTATLTQLTRFVGVRVRLGDEQERFVLAATLDGAPADREDRLLAHLISDPSRLVRYLLMLLAGGPEDRFDADFQRMLDAAAIDGANLETLPLMEVMLRAVIRAPERMRSVRRLISVVRSHPHLADASLIALWDSISALVEQEAR